MAEQGARHKICENSSFLFIMYKFKICAQYFKKITYRLELIMKNSRKHRQKNNMQHKYFSQHIFPTRRKTSTHRLYITCFIAIILICLFGHSKLTNAQKNVAEIQKDIADSLVRFHVVSAGDSEYEQSLKLLVKNSVLNFLSEKLAFVSSKEETLTIIEELTPQIISIAQSVLSENNCNIPVTANIEESFFPVKAYGDLTLPAGKYTALKIVLGEGKGTNWWCVLYPPLCFVDATYGVVPDESKAAFKALLSEDEYNMIFSENVVFRFKILKFLNNFFK